MDTKRHNQALAQLKRKCDNYIKMTLRAPPLSMVTRWGRQFKLTTKEIMQVSDSIVLRRQLGKFRLLLLQPRL